MRCLLAAALVLGLIGAHVAVAEPTIRYYNIRGASHSELSKQLSSRSGIRRNGKTFDALTEWNVAWNFRYEPRRGSCVMTRISTEVDATITLPRWMDPSRAPPALVRRWQSYMTALRAHEQTHYSHAVEAARKIERLGRSFRINGNCNRMNDAFNDKANAIIEQARAADRSYDRRTGHGRTEGAQFR